MGIRSAILVIVAIAAPARADQRVAPRGWTADGRMVVQITESTQTWAKGQTAHMGVCKPMRFGDGSACEVCGANASDAVGCGARPGKRPATAMTSPDRRVKLAKAIDCAMTGHDLDMKMCTQTVTVGYLGALSHTAELTNRGQHARLTTWFRPDSGAVFVEFAHPDGDEFYVIDIGEIQARDQVPAAVAELFARQQRALRGEAAGRIYALDATFFTDDPGRGAFGAADLPAAIGATTKLAVTGVEIEPSLDGSAAWIVFRAGDYRGTELARRTDAGWVIAAGMFSRGLPDHEARRRARARSLQSPVDVARHRADLDAGISVLGAMFRDGDPEIVRHFARRKRTFAIGTAANERVVGNLPAAWKGWLAGGVAGPRVRGGWTAGETTGWLIANMEVRESGYTIPVRVFAIFDRDREVEPTGREIVLTHAAVVY